MKISTMIIGLLLISVLVFGFYQFATDLGDSETGYDVAVDDDAYIQSFDKSRNISDQVNESYHNIQDDLRANTAASYITLIPEVVVLVINLVELPFTLMGGIITAIIDYMGLPSWVNTFMITVMVVLLVFALVALALRYKDT